MSQWNDDEKVSSEDYADPVQESNETPFIVHDPDASAQEYVAQSPPPALMLKGLNLNTATVVDLVAGLDEVGDGLAYQIIREREQHGPFLDLHDLERVPGLGPKTFERLVELPWREGGGGNSDTVLEILGFDESRHVRAQDVAVRFSGLKGFEGCIIAHVDGYVLGEYWEHEARATLGMIAPQFSKKLNAYIHQLNMGPLDSLTLYVAEQPITMVCCEELVLVAIHKPNCFNRKQVRLAQQVISKLRLLMLRDYQR